MPSFRKAKEQAKHAVKVKWGIGTARHVHKQDSKIHSLGTARNYEQALTRFTAWLQTNRLGDLKNITINDALHYLEQRGQCIGQKLLDQERQAIQLHLGEKLLVIKSELSQALKSRAYTVDQIELVTHAQSEKNRLSTEIAYAAGLRAHELLTLRRKEERLPSAHREWSNDRFAGRQGMIYTVIGKGGLMREVIIPVTLAIQLEEFRLSKSRQIKDREIFYHSLYNINGGKKWSNSFSSASKRSLGWSHGAHGVRHTYAQQRMCELQQHGFNYIKALGIVSQELGHFRPDITEVYLR